jgi:hypothetical protein
MNCEAYLTSYSMDTLGSFLGVEQTKLETDHSHPYAEINEWSYTSMPPQPHVFIA